MPANESEWGHAERDEPVAFSEGELQTLCASDLFRGCTRQDVVALLTRFDVRRRVCPGGNVVAGDHETLTRMGVLLSGFLHVYDSALKGQRHLVRIVRPGQVLGATHVGAPQKACPALVTAYGDCVLATLSLPLIYKLSKMGGGVCFMTTYLLSYMMNCRRLGARSPF